MAQIILPGNADPTKVLSGSTFSAGTNYNTSGTMPNNGAVAITPNASSQTIAAGYHNGSGTVAGVTVPAANVLTGTTIAGTAGTMPNQGAKTFTPSTGNQAIPAGYHNGSGIVQGDPNLISGNIKSGVSIFGISGNVVPGMMAIVAGSKGMLTWSGQIISGSGLNGSQTDNYGCQISTTVNGYSCEYCYASAGIDLTNYTKCWYVAQGSNVGTTASGYSARTTFGIATSQFGAIGTNTVNWLDQSSTVNSTPPVTWQFRDITSYSGVYYFRLNNNVSTNGQGGTAWVGTVILA